MTRPNAVCTNAVLFLVAITLASGALAHEGHEATAQSKTPHRAGRLAQGDSTRIHVAQDPGKADRISGQGDLRFRVLYTGDHLPQAAVRVLDKAHGGFAIDRREGRNEVYFALPGAGIIRLSGDLQHAQMLNTDSAMKDENMHNATVWYRDNGGAYLSFPANGVGKVFTTTLDGTLLHTLNTPGKSARFDEPTVDTYFREGSAFVPTDVDYLDGMFYVSTGYSKLDYVLTARLTGGSSPKFEWNDLAFGGRGEGVGQFGTGHGITVSPDRTRVIVSDRLLGKLETFTRYGHYRGTVSLPEGAWPVDVDFLAGYTIAGCLHGLDRKKGAPIYILKDGVVVSTIWPKEELGLDTFQHLHDAVLHQVAGKLYIIAQTWNPGDFAILEQVVAGPERN